MTSKILKPRPKRQSTLFHYSEAAVQRSSVKSPIQIFSKNPQENNYDGDLF